MYVIYTVVGILFAVWLNTDCSATVHTSCEDGWLSFEGSCYLIGHDDFVFVEAEQFCQQHKSHLVEPYTDYENKFLKDQFRALLPHCYWVGASDGMVEGVWRWYNTDNLMNYTDWYPGQPSNAYEDCGVFWRAYDFRWGDITCTYRCHPVCKQSGFAGDPEFVGR